MSSYTNEHGRFQLRVDHEAGTAWMVIENVNRTGEHWLTLASTGRPHTTIGYLRLRPTRPDSTMFEVAEVRPATGSLLPARDEPAVARPHRGLAQVSTPARRHQTPKEQIALIERLDPNYVPPPQPDYDDVPVCCCKCGRIDGDIITEWVCPECAALNRGEQEVGRAL